MSFQEKVVVLTGAASGIGKATVQLLVEQGAKVAALDLKGEQLQEAFGKDPRVLCIPTDVSNSDAVRAAFQAIESKFGRLDVIVNAAGINAPNREANQKMVDANVAALDAMKSGRAPVFDFLADTSDQDFRRVMEVNLFSQFYCIREGVPLMRRSGGGSIVNISSVAALMGVAMPLYYPASKAAVLGLTRAAAAELAPYNIRVNAIAPGSVDTPLMHEQPPEVVQFLVSMQPIKRLAKPEELAQSILFLAGEHSSFITGQTLSPNGGMYM
ncbi:SDR family NAD(P)-dependent oxidoreductase [Pseudomonas extremaustralis]|uniref:SDR family NAD(P)-dependent oxidoreductase n=1 Tax=Pseudomonas extremaustralis TaxID=359110 RepID=UPI00285C0473|nr:SDR family NAD(P)-dependent oxidoreductase [Pseudomonas extremaustralis]MDR6581696.1 NAD(P)-dependent dehydrogenase (short-subunit alcohol dehydrogenase family) [Pseudomonas extremaustralis]